MFFPLTFPVPGVVKLRPTTAVPVLGVRDVLSVFRDLKSPSHLNQVLSRVAR